MEKLMEIITNTEHCYTCGHNQTYHLTEEFDSHPHMGRCIIPNCPCLAFALHISTESTKKKPGDYINDAEKEIAKNNALLLELTPKIKAEMGEKIMGKALEKIIEKRQEEVLDQITQLVAELETARAWERYNRECAEIIEKKIQAVRDGAFSIQKGYGSAPKIIFDNPDFNKPYPHDMGFSAGTAWMGK